MKKLLLLAAVTILAVGCASSDTQDQRQKMTAQEAKYQIIDQEFDNMLAPEANYEVVPPYEEQVTSSSYIQSVQTKGKVKPGRKASSKPAKQMPATTTQESGKTVTTGEGSEAAPVTDQEVLPSMDLPDTL